MSVRLWLALSLCACGITWAYTTGVLAEWVHFNEVRQGLLMQMGDLYSPWMGTRELLLHHRNPYGPEVSHEIQMAFYGRAIDDAPTKSGVPVLNEQRFAYPVYVVLLLAPSAYVDFAIVRRWAWIGLALLIVCTVLLSLDFLSQRMPWQLLMAIILFTLCSPQIVQGLQFEQLAIVVGFLLVAGTWCVSKNHLVWAGALFALSTIKPQLALLPLCAFAIWTLGDWRRRWQLASSFGAVGCTLFVAAEVLLPGWFGYFLRNIAAYRKYAPTSSLLWMLMGDRVGMMMSGAIIIALLVFGWRNRAVTANSVKFVDVVVTFLMGVSLAFPLFTPFNQVLLILPALLLVRDWKTLPKLSRLVFIVVVSWPWMISPVMTIFRLQLNSPSQLPLLPLFMVSFFPLFLPLLLMTRRQSFVA